MAQYIFSDPFWMAQVAQVDITTERNFEMIPVVGNHLVKLGNGENIDKKFHRLFVFYKEVLSKTGFAKYKVIDVQYAGQVIALKQSDEAKVDSVQLRKNVEKLLRQAQQPQTDTITTTKPLTEKPNIKVDSATAPTINLKATAGKKMLPAPKESLRTGQADKKPTSPNPVKSFLKPKPDEKKIPKAVMPKKVVVNDE